jgi:hypothetical protein
VHCVLFKPQWHNIRCLQNVSMNDDKSHKTIIQLYKKVVILICKWGMT